MGLGQWLLPAVAAVAIVAGAGLLMQQLFLRWNQGQDLRQALITIAISIILADQMLAHFGGVAEDISWPSSTVRPPGVGEKCHKFSRATSTDDGDSGIGKFRRRRAACGCGWRRGAHNHHMVVRAWTAALVMGW